MKANQFTQNLRKDEKANIAMIGVIIALAVSIVIGVLVFYKINAAVGLNHKPLGTWGANYNTSRSSINTSAQTTFTLLPIIALIVIAAFMIGLVTRFGQG